MTEYGVIQGNEKTMDKANNNSFRNAEEHPVQREMSFVLLFGGNSFIIIKVKT